MNDNDCVLQVLSGNTSAFAYFVETYQDMAVTIAFRICGNRQDAEDVVQESYLKAFRNLHSFRSESKFSTWFYRIVYNAAVTHSCSKMWLREGQTGLSAAADTPLPSPDAELERREQAQMVERTLQELPKGDALLLTLYYMEDHSVKEIAQITGLNLSNVKVRLFRARKLFKEHLPAGVY
ncbi:MAG TPA: hypothetical protein DEF88_07905 [Porphyromonadaceae bacterium]|jgi:RNA polymerase sigma-70 factor (ECF subfamily)|nr:hypothetical protein [Porphyromonadaceae bacterium]HBX20356.1 hypothetical protein [Porphyromonadaceae bacterium]HCM21509.1 hypothetical protein [Porphyromonadaceae bacterium]